MPEDLFPKQHLDKCLKKNSAIFELNKNEVECFISSASHNATDPHKLLEDVQKKELIAEALKTLTEREQIVIEHRFEINGKPFKTLEELGKMFGVEPERIRQIEARALRLLRHPTRSKDLIEYLPGATRKGKDDD